MTPSDAAPYCTLLKARATPSPPYTYRPFALPDGARLRTPPPALGFLQRGLPVDIPVLHTRDGYATPFYYYAQGCSDLHVRAKKVIVASNRIHALHLTHKHSAFVILQERCGHELVAANLSAKQVILSLSVVAPDPSILTKIAAFSSWVCAHHLNAVLYSWMVNTNHDTLVLNYEYEGIPTRPLRWKAEVLHIGRLVYNANHTACSVQVLDRRCVHCGRMGTPTTWDVCRQVRGRDNPVGQGS